jgi:lysyl-tRNA synthetase, class I
VMNLQSADREIVGKGTWMDKIAYSILNREKNLGRPLKLLRVESGLGASGIPHIGSMADAVRSYGISMALKNLGYNSELVTFSDDLDGLRKIPVGFPPWLKEYVAKPVSTIPDPLGSCHGSYGDHMTDSLLKGLDTIGVKYKFLSATEAYRRGTFINQIDTILRRSKNLGRKIVKLVGQEKFIETLPYFPICESCGRLYVARAEVYHDEPKSVSYNCIGSKIGKNFVPGCGNTGEAAIAKGQGKLAWKAEFAARWMALDIRFEAFGKDIMDSVRVNDWVSNEILSYPHPLHVKYELFLDRTGKKISKSTGNVLTPQKWLQYGTPESLMLLFFRRIVGTRLIGLQEIPLLMNEYDFYEDVYFGRISERNIAKRMKIKGVYEYVNHLKPPKFPEDHITYEFLVQQGSLFSLHEREEKVLQRLERYKMIRKKTGSLIRRIRLASNWIEDKIIDGHQVLDISLSTNEKKALTELVETLRSYVGAEDKQNTPLEVQTKIFEIARNNEVQPKDFFRLLYNLILHSDRGPRLGNYVIDLGIQRTCEILTASLGHK